jgi:hypothetical protein
VFQKKIPEKNLAKIKMTLYFIKYLGQKNTIKKYYKNFPEKISKKK